MLEGDLTDFTLPEILRLLDATGKTGRLTVTSGPVSGRIEVRDGRIEAATADTGRFGLARRLLGAGVVESLELTAALDAHEGAPTDLELARAITVVAEVPATTVEAVLRAQIVDAVFDLVRRPTGRFRFVALAADGLAPGHDVGIVIEDLLVEVTGRLVRWHDLVAASGDLDDIVSLAAPAAGDVGDAPVTLEADVWSLVALVDGRRTVAELIDVSGQGAFRTRTTLASLRERGVVAITAADAPTPSARLVAAQEALRNRERAVAGTSPVATPSLRPDPTVDHDLLDRLVAGVAAL